MPYSFLEDVAIADVAFEARGKSAEELFENAAMAVTNTMVKDPATVEPKTEKSFEVSAENVEMLLFNFLQELIFLKDAQLLLFSRFDLAVSRDFGGWRLRAKASGEELNPEKHELLSDVKAVSLHNFAVEETPWGWRAFVILDV